MSPRGEIKVDAAEGGAFWRSLEPPWPVLEFLPPGVFVVSPLMLKAGGPLGSDLSKRKPCEFVGSIWGNTSIPISL